MKKVKKAAKKKKFDLTTLILILAFVVGLSLVLYPTVADYWNSFRSSRTIESYADAVNHLQEDEYQRILTEAEEYNKTLVNPVNDTHILTAGQQVTYESLLDVGGTGVMGYIEIDTIDVKLPIYHGTSEAVLQVGVGHLDWTSLPIGGESTHCVLSGHRGLPSAKLFTNLDKLVEGDLFVLKVLNNTLTYEIDQILIVLPEEVSALEITEGEDYCTLVTCTPYGVNSHRMLVRGHRVDNEELYASDRVVADAEQVEPLIVAPIIATPIIIALVVYILVSDKKKREKARTKAVVKAMVKDKQTREKLKAAQMSASQSARSPKALPPGKAQRPSQPTAQTRQRPPQSTGTKPQQPPGQKPPQPPRKG